MVDDRTLNNALNYCAVKLILFSYYFPAQGQMSGDNPVLAAGRYQYPFQFQLPHQLPSSFEGQYGRVRYSVKAVIDKPWKFDHEVKRPFTVISNVDLNLMPNAAVRIIILILFTSL